MVAELLEFTVLCMAKTVLSFVFHSSLQTAKSVDSVVARDGFLCITEKNLPLFFIPDILITQSLIKYFVFRTLFYLG